MTDINALLRELEAPSYKSASDSENARLLLEQLESEGELRPAEAQELERLRTEAPANQQMVGQTDALYRGALQGGTFNFADELSPLFGGSIDEARRKNLEAQASFPDEYNKGKTAGALGTSTAIGAGTAPLAIGKTLWGIMGRGALLGGLEGALWGAGEGEGLKDKAVQAGKYGGIGLGIGLAAPAVVAGTSAGIRGLSNIVGGLINKGNSGRANRAILEALRKAGITVDQADDAVTTAARQGQPEFRLMDALGVTGQRKASGIARSGGDGAEEIAQYLQQRQADQSDRVLNFVDDAFGTNGTTAEKTRTLLKENRKSTADTLYDNAAADAAPVDVRGAVDILDETISKMTNSGIKPPKVVKEYQKWRSRLAGKTPEGDPTTLSDYESVLGVWRELRDTVDAAYQKGNGAVGEALKPVRDKLQSALEESSDLYRFANDNYREASKVMGAVDTGADMARAGRAQDNIPQFQGMTPQQQRAARIGYGDTISSSIERNKAQAPNAAREFNSTKRQAESEAMALNPALLRDRIARENMMHETFQRALGGSRTADNLEDIADTGLIADAARASRDVASGNFGNAASTAVAPVVRAATGQNEATRRLISEMLMSSSPQQSLKQAVRQQGRSDIRQRIAEAMLRAAARENTPY